MKVVRFNSNPFLNELEVKSKRKTVRVNASLGRDDNIIINQSSGEVIGAYTHISTFKEVDQSEFVKLFSANIALTFDLTSTGIKALNVLIYAVQKQAIERDVVALDKFVLKEFLSLNGFEEMKLSQPTFTRGLSELVKCQIIARHSRQGFFFINPSFVFNGDRIAFTTAIIKGNSKSLRQEKIEDK